MYKQKKKNIPFFIPALSAIVLFFIYTGCGNQAILESEEIAEDECGFFNPVAAGADPWIIKKNGKYFFSESEHGGIYISESETLTGIKINRKKVWQQPETGWNASSLWAPEIHYIRGRWYIYYTAGKSGPPFIHQRSGVLRSITDDPMGEYEDMGRLYTGDYIETGEENTWAIDLTVLERDDRLYAIWSGWTENAETDRTPQHLYIAEMENPWTIAGNRVKISSPQESWETGTELAINEGPQILKNKDDDIFIIYSASESWLPAYNLGQLRLKTRDTDPVNPGNWIKSGPVFEGRDQVFGAGHASFTTSPDGTENWILYHTKTDSSPGWERVVHMQQFDWNEDASPNFGNPSQPGEKINNPSGECS